MDTWSRGKKQSQTNPNKAKQSQLNPIKANKMPKQTQNEANTNPIHPGGAGFHRSVDPAEPGTNPASKRRKITCFGTGNPYNYRFGINIGDFLCVNNAAVVVLTQKPPSKTR